jgi:two-component system cell cycle response regulator
MGTPSTHSGAIAPCRPVRADARCVMGDALKKRAERPFPAVSSVEIESAPPADRPRRILIVDDDAARRELFARVLSHEGYEVDLLPDGSQLVAHVRARPPDLVLLDIMLPEVSGFELCGDLRMMDDTRLTPIILITSTYQDEESAVRGLLSGADDYVVTPSRLDELRARVRVQLRNRRDREMLQWAKAQRATLKTAAMSDALTGLANRRAADEVLEPALDSGEGLLAILIDIDHFKQINDTYGHVMGDQVLTQVARAIKACTRSGDLAARYGGEEFLVIVRGAALDVAARIGERYRKAVRQIELPPRPGVSPGPERKLVTVSVGVAGTAGGGVAGRKALLAAADEALYEAKLSGRDRVIVCPRPVTGAFDGLGRQGTSLVPPKLLDSVAAALCGPAVPMPMDSTARAPSVPGLPMPSDSAGALSGPGAPR